MVIGGTHVPWSPSFHYLKEVFLPMLSVIGVSTDLDIEKVGLVSNRRRKVIAASFLGKSSPIAISDRGKPS
jgi:RNA 3'-terminal phosphate cyclase (ATP)